MSHAAVIWVGKKLCVTTDGDYTSIFQWTLVFLLRVTTDEFFETLLGDAGLSGKAGIRGPPGPKGQKGQEGQGLSGVKYVRWGRTSCSGAAQVVYSGKHVMTLKPTFCNS